VASLVIVVSAILVLLCGQTDRQTDRQTHRHTDVDECFTLTTVVCKGNKKQEQNNTQKHKITNLITSKLALVKKKTH